MMSKRFSLIALYFLIFSSGASAANADFKLGVVDMQRAIQSVSIGKKAKSTLESEFNRKKDELKKEEASIVQLRDEFAKKSAVMNEKTRLEKQGELQQKLAMFQQKMAKSQMEIQQREQQLTKPIVDKLQDIIQELAKEKGYTTVLEKSGNVVLYWQDKDDLTNEVITAFNKKHKG